MIARARGPSGWLAFGATTLIAGVLGLGIGWVLASRNVKTPQQARPVPAATITEASAPQSKRPPAAPDPILRDVSTLANAADEDARLRLAGELARERAQVGSLRDALRSAIALPPSPARDALLTELVGCWPENEASEVFAILIAAPPDSLPLEAVAATASLLARSGADTAAPRIASLPPSATKDAAAAAFARTWAESAPAAAFAWARTLPEGTARTGALTESALAWTRKDPAQVGAIILSNPDLRESPENAMLVASVASAMSAAKPDHAASWAALLPPGGSRNAALSIAAIGLAKTNPAQAIQTAAQIPDPVARITAFENILLDWPEEQTAARSATLDQLIRTERDPSARRAIEQLATEMTVP